MRHLLLTLSATAAFLIFPSCKDLGKSLFNAEELRRQIFPMSDTWSWTYNVTLFGTSTFGSACKAGQITRTTQGSATYAKKTGTQMPSLCQSGSASTTFAAEGDQVWYWNGVEWATYLEAPLTEGRKFLSGTQSYTWYRPFQMTVPAGTFSDCWTKKNDKSDSSETFCRGVGLVSAYQTDVYGNGWKAVLERASGPTVPVRSVTTSPQTEGLEN